MKSPPRLGVAEVRSKVAYDLEDVGDGVTKLTVTHDGFAPVALCSRPSAKDGLPSFQASRPS
jgi:hypothetical protein